MACLEMTSGERAVSFVTSTSTSAIARPDSSVKPARGSLTAAAIVADVGVCGWEGRRVFGEGEGERGRAVWASEVAGGCMRGL